MSLLAAVFDWWNPSPPTDDVERLLSEPRARVSDGYSFARVPHGTLGFGRRLVRPSEKADTQPFLDPESGISVVGDLRLDNRQELRSVLSGHRAIDSDAGLLVAAYERWGDEAAAHLVGDFAFVLWDSRRRRVYAARDAFGVRPLVYRRTARNLIFASSPQQLLALADTDRTPNDRAVVDYLSRTWAHYGPTFFKAIDSVRPGHYLWASAGNVSEVEYFRPPTEQLVYRNAEDYAEQFRGLFEQAVKDRLDSDFPIVADLSGGLDSSSIVCMADRIYESTPGAPFHTVSAVFPGQPYDETGFIDTVSKSVRFQSHRYNGNMPSDREFSSPSLNIPGGSVATNSGSICDIELARTIGARTILCGDPGDFVTGEFGLFNELLVRGKWPTIVQQILAGHSPLERRVRLLLLRRAVHDEAPDALLRVWRARPWAPRVEPPPGWLNGEFHGLWRDPEFGNPPRRNQGFDRVARAVWDRLRWSRWAWGVDSPSGYAADAGMEMRFPFLDQRLIAFILAVPYQHRLLGAVRRRLHRNALRGVLPDAIASRASKAVFNGAMVRWGHAMLPAIRDILEDGDWHSGRFVAKEGARALVNRLASKAPEVGDRKGWMYVRAIVNMEAWHRAVFRYAYTKETLLMSEIKAPSVAESQREESRSSEVPYEAPKLTAVGNVRGLLANGSFSGDDNLGQGPHSADQPGG